MNTKMIATIVGLIAIIVLVVYIGIIRRAGDSKPPEWVSDQPVELIDTKTGDLVTLARGEMKDGRAENPNTGEFTLVVPIVCESCKEKVVGPPGMPVADPNMGGKAYAAAVKKGRELKLEYPCPKCGQPVISGGRSMPIPATGGPAGSASE